MRTNSLKKRLVALALMIAVVFGTMIAVSNEPSTVEAKPTVQHIFVDGRSANPTVYSISGNNYFKLRDLGRLLDFGVTYDAATHSIYIDSSASYVAEDGESSINTAHDNATGRESTQTLYIDGVKVDAKAYLIDGNNYYKLRDIARLMNFGVIYSAMFNAVYIQSDEPYDENAQIDPVVISEPSKKVESEEDPIKTVSNNPSYTYDTRLTDPSTELFQTTRESNPEEILQALELAMVDAVNEERRNAGLNELVIDETLMDFAHYWAEYMATTEFKHATWTYRDEYADKMGIDKNILNCGENIVGGASVRPLVKPVVEYMNGLIGSPGHYSTMMRPENTTIGIGYAFDSDKTHLYCCQEFGYPTSGRIL